jgi:hypothetical protein
LPAGASSRHGPTSAPLLLNRVQKQLFVIILIMIVVVIACIVCVVSFDVILYSFDQWPGLNISDV